MSTVLSLPKKILHSRIFSFLCIKLYISGKEDSNERNPSGVSFVFVQVAFALQRRGEGAPAPCTESAFCESSTLHSPNSTLFRIAFVLAK